MENKYDQSIRKMIIRHKICGNCGATMIFNELLQRWVCKLCGNDDPNKIVRGIKIINYTN